MMLPKGFFDVQVTFALKVAELSNIHIEDALLNYTFFYRNFFVPSKRFIKTKKEWKDFLQELKDNDYKNITEIAYKYSEKRMKARNSFEIPLYSGNPCFISEIQGSNVYLHFNNNEGSNPGPLSHERINQRLAELTNIFSSIKTQHPEVTSIYCYSWLNNLPSFTRLFPNEFGKNSLVVRNDFRSLDIWGQFLDSGYNLKQVETREFLRKVGGAKSVKELKSSFQLYPIIAHCDVDNFYTLYKI